MKCDCDKLPEPPPAPPRYIEGHKLIGPFLHATGLTCRKFTELSVERMDSPLKPLSKLRWILHWLLCDLCRPLPRRLANLRVLMREVDRRGDLADPAAQLPEESRTRMMEALRRESEK